MCTVYFDGTVHEILFQKCDNLLKSNVTRQWWKGTDYVLFRTQYNAKPNDITPGSETKRQNVVNRRCTNIRSLLGKWFCNIFSTPCTWKRSSKADFTCDANHNRSNHRKTGMGDSNDCDWLRKYSAMKLARNCFRNGTCKFILVTLNLTLTEWLRIRYQRNY